MCLSGAKTDSCTEASARRAFGCHQKDEAGAEVLLKYHELEVSLQQS